MNITNAAVLIYITPLADIHSNHGYKYICIPVTVILDPDLWPSEDMLKGTSFLSPLEERPHGKGQIKVGPPT